MSGRHSFLFWTLIAVLALVFFYTFSSRRLYMVSVSGDETFRDSVKRALGAEHLRFKFKKGSDISFDQERRVFQYKGKVYHLYWNEDVVDKARELSGCHSCELIPIVHGELDEDYFKIFRECARIIKGRPQGLFENGWLMVKMGLIEDGKLRYIYDPITGSLRGF